MAKGQEAKNFVIEKIKSVFGEDYIGENASKHYVWSKEGGQKVQVAISLTCPKTPIGQVDMSSAFGDGIDFSAAPVAAQTAPTAEITQEEKANIAELMTRLGL